MAYDSGWAKRVVQVRKDSTLYLSVPFTWLVNEARSLAEAHRGPVVAGGPGLELLHPGGVDWAATPERPPFDVLRLHHPDATFTTRGCPRRCAFCAVPRLEGEFRELNDWRPARLVCDSNFLAASREHIECVIERLSGLRGVDFNQGLDARLFKPWHARLLKKLRGVKVRFSCDRPADERATRRAIDICRASKLSIRGVYVLIGYKDTFKKARKRLDTVRGWGVRPFPMRYQPLDATEKNAYLPKGWTGLQMRLVLSYYMRLRYVEHIPFEDYARGNISARQTELWGSSASAQRNSEGQDSAKG